MNQMTRLWISSICFGLAAPAAFGITNGDRPESDDRRFDAVGALSIDKYLGQAPEGENVTQNHWWCTATLIEKDVILTAKHCIGSPTSEWMVRFRRQTDGTLGTIEDGADSFFHARVGSWEFPTELDDVAIGFLDEEVTHIRPIPAITRGQNSLTDMPVIQAGWGKEGPGFDQGPKRELLLCDNVGRSASTKSVQTLNPTTNGCGVNMNDSGSPILFESSRGALRVSAVVTGVTTAQSLRAIDGAYESVTHRPFKGVDFNVEPLNSVDWQRMKPGSALTVALRGGDYGTAQTTPPVVEVSLANGPLVELAQTVTLTEDSYDDWVDYSINIPTTLPPNTYDLYATIDPADATNEVIEDNNETRRITLVTVTPVKHTAKQITYVPVYDSSGLVVGNFAFAVERIGRVTLIGGLSGDDTSSRTFKTGVGPIQFKSAGVPFEVVQVDGLWTLRSLQAEYRVGISNPISDLGAGGHVHGVYQGVQVVDGVRVPARMIVTADRRAWFGTTDSAPQSLGYVDPYDRLKVHVNLNGTLVEGKFVWQAARKTWEVQVSDTSSTVSLTMNTGSTTFIRPSTPKNTARATTE